MADQEEKKIIVKVAYNYFQSGQWDRALEEYKKLIAIDPMDFLVHNMMAEIYSRKGEKKSAINEFLNAANLLRATNNLEKAIHAYNHVGKLDPENEEAKSKKEETVRTRIAEIEELQRRGSVKNALEMCERLLNRVPEHPLVQAKLKELEESMLDRKSRTLLPKNSDNSTSDISALNTIKDEGLNKEDVVKNLYSMAESYEKKQSWEEAAEAYITILRFVPKDETAKNKLKEIYQNITRNETGNIENNIINNSSQKIDTKKEEQTVNSNEMEKLRIQAEERLRQAVEDRRERERQKNEYLLGNANKTVVEDQTPVNTEQDIHVLLTQTQMYIHQNLLVEAMRLCQRILEIDPQNKEVRGLLKKIYDRKNL